MQNNKQNINRSKQSLISPDKNMFNVITQKADNSKYIASKKFLLIRKDKLSITQLFFLSLKSNIPCKKSILTKNYLSFNAKSILKLQQIIYEVLFKIFFLKDLTFAQLLTRHLTIMC